ncbi:MAG TPA: 1,4-alpha-glucan branching protein domain-containing protein [Hyalangium sp.]|jgi:1,4-alpha-glucan branching enzyme|nr:1,4-alpha-glucan branching protein domain-containing protein [Hyalangium sp.]
MSQGSLALVLHAHLPFVRHPEHEDFLEEDWLYEAISETYLPLLRVFDQLAEEGVPFRVTMSLTPTLVTMLRDELLTGRYTRKLDQLCELGAREVHRTRNDPTFGPLARFYRDHFESLRVSWHGRYHGDLVSAFRRLQDAGYLEILTCNATHGFLPLLQETPEAVRAQISVAANHYRLTFGRDAPGIWLAECGYFPGVERFLAAERIRYFFVDTHGLTDATPRPLYGPFAPIYTEAGVGVYARDPESSQQVWSSEMGYPGDPVYREFYRDIGWDLDLDYIRPFIQPTGDRKNTGYKYFRITGDTRDKHPYDPAVARARAATHAGNFMFNREKQIEYLSSRMGDRKPVVVAPYDAELFGHWWFEGPWFLDFLIRKVAYDQRTFRLVTASDDLREHPRNQVATPPLSSWGSGGYANMWLDGSNDWIYRHLHHCARQMVGLARDFPEATALQRRALNQAARELLLAQSSDWAFIMKTGTMVDYAVRRTKEHVLRFLRLHDQVRGGNIDEPWLSQVESRNNIFPEIDYRVYRPL